MKQTSQKPRKRLPTIHKQQAGQAIKKFKNSLGYADSVVENEDISLQFTDMNIPNPNKQGSEIQNSIIQQIEQEKIINAEVDGQHISDVRCKISQGQQQPQIVQIVPNSKSSKRSLNTFFNQNQLTSASPLRLNNTSFEQHIPNIARYELLKQGLKYQRGGGGGGSESQQVDNAKERQFQSKLKSLFSSSPLVSAQNLAIKKILQNKQQNNSIHISMRSFSLSKEKGIHQFETDIQKIQENIMTKSLSILSRRCHSDIPHQQQISSPKNQDNAIKRVLEMESQMQEESNPSEFFIAKKQLHFTQNPEVSHILDEIALHHNKSKTIKTESNSLSTTLPLPSMSLNSSQQQRYSSKSNHFSFSQQIPKTLGTTPTTTSQFQTPSLLPFLNSTKSERQQSYQSSLSPISGIKRDIFAFRKTQNSDFLSRGDYSVCQEREEARALLNWVDQIMDKILSKNDASFQQIFQELELILHGAFHDLTRQISKTCEERGQVLTTVWNIYNCLISQTFSQHRAIFENTSKEESDHSQRLSTIYHQRFLELEASKQQLATKVEQLEESTKKMLDSNLYLRKKLNKVEKEKFEVQSDLAFSEKELQEYKMKNNYLLALFNEQETQKKIPVQTRVSPRSHLDLQEESITPQHYNINVHFNEESKVDCTSFNSFPNNNLDNPLQKQQQFKQNMHKEHSILKIKGNLSQPINNKFSYNRTFKSIPSIENDIFLKNQEEKSLINVGGIKDNSMNTDFKYFIDRIDKQVGNREYELVDLETQYKYIGINIGLQCSLLEPPNDQFDENNHSPNYTNISDECKWYVSQKSKMNEEEKEKVINLIEKYELELNEKSEILQHQLREILELSNKLADKQLNIIEMEEFIANKDIIIKEMNQSIFDKQSQLEQCQANIAHLQFLIDKINTGSSKNYLENQSDGKLITSIRVLESKHNMKDSIEYNSQIAYEVAEEDEDDDDNGDDDSIILEDSNTKINLSWKSKKSSQNIKNKGNKQKGKHRGSVYAAIGRKQSKEEYSLKTGNDKWPQAKSSLQMEFVPITANSPPPPKKDKQLSIMKVIGMQQIGNRLIEKGRQSQIQSALLNESQQSLTQQQKRLSSQISFSRASFTGEKIKQDQVINREQAESILSAARQVVVNDIDLKQTSQVTKIIGSVYQDYFKQMKKGGDQEEGQQAIHILYDMFLHRFGVKKIAEKKLLDLLISIKKSEINPKIRVFSYIMGLGGKEILSPVEVQFYVKCMKKLEECSIDGKSGQVSIDRLKISRARMSEVVSYLFYNQVSTRDQISFIDTIFAEIEHESNQLKNALLNQSQSSYQQYQQQYQQQQMNELITSQMNSNNNKLRQEEFEIDLVADKMLNLHLQLRSMQLERILKLFKLIAQREEYINIEEFILIINSIHSNYTHIDLAQLFNDQADQYVDSERTNNLNVLGSKEEKEQWMMSLKLFCKICEDKQLLRTQDITNYLQCQQQQQSQQHAQFVENKIQTIQQLCNNWSKLEQMLLSRFNKIQNLLHNQLVITLSSYLQEINKRMSHIGYNKYDSRQQLDENEQDEVYMLLFRILCDKSRQTILEHETNLLLGNQLYSLSQALKYSLFGIA